MATRRSRKRKITEVEDENKIKNHFYDVMGDSKYEWIDPNSCIPFTKTRPITESGVLRLMQLFDATQEGDSIAGGGMSCGTSTPIVVALTGSNLKYVHDHFRKKGCTESETIDRVNARTLWYGIIDGEHSFHAIKRLMETKKRWEGYEWFVTIAKEGFTLDRYRQLARMNNEKKDCRFNVEYTFFDMISNMKTEYDKLCQVQSRVVGQDVVSAYCGFNVTSKKVSTLLQTANTVMRLPSSVIHTIGEVANSEHPDWLLANSRLNKSRSTTVQEVMRNEDCRVFKNFIHITSIKSAKAFMTAKHKEGERAQIYTIYRIQDIYRQRSFTKPIQPDEVGKQYELSVYSIEEEEKFLSFISPDLWPEEMNTLRQNLLKTVQLSEEVESNRGNREVLPSLLRAYKRHFPAKYIVKQQSMESKIQISEPPVVKDADCNSTSATEADHRTDLEIRSDEPLSSDLHRSDQDTELLDPNSVMDGDQAAKTRDAKTKERLDSLKEKGITCYNMRWQEFMSDVWKKNDKQVDAIITNPPPTPSLSFINSDKRIRSLPNQSSSEELRSSDIGRIAKYGRELLKPGGYFIVMIDFDMFKEWYLAFKSNGYDVMKRTLTFSYKQSSAPRRSMEENFFPHGMEEDCVVARIPGLHPDGFVPKFDTAFNLIECSWTRRAPIVTNVDPPKNKLCFLESRKPVRMSEKPVKLLAEVIDLFVSPYGTTLDLFAGTMTLPIAALQSSRRCVAIEQDKVCFDLSIDRLYGTINPIFKFILNVEAASKPKNVASVTIAKSSTIGLKSTNITHLLTSAKPSGNSDGRTLLRTSLQDTSKDFGEYETEKNVGENCEDLHSDKLNTKNESPNTKKKMGSNENCKENINSSHKFKTYPDIEASTTLIMMKNNKN